jgi:signal transduction histidine kinase
MKKADILIVEDDVLTATVLQKYLLRCDYNVLPIAANASTALKLVEANKPDLILMDIFLKDSIDGIEIVKLLKNQYDIPVIYLTADSSEETIQRAKITEPFGYLVKPVDNKTLITNVELTLQKQLSYNHKLLEALRKANDELEQRVKERTTELSTKNLELLNEIKHRKLAEEALRKAERLATIGRMSAVLAHEIRNPLNSIKINSDILLESLELPENKKRRLQIIQKEVNRLDRLVKEVLLFSRQSELVYSEFNIFNLIENISAQFKPSFDEKQIKFINSTGNITIKGDAEKLKQVFLNLILNSYDAVKEQGIIEISSENKKDNTLHLYIKDNGCGIQNTDKLFEPFFTSKSQGTGLGLPISQNIIEQHSGTLKLMSSQPGETIFDITLPLKL